LRLRFRQRFADAHGAPKVVDDWLLAVDNPLLLLLDGPDPEEEEMVLRHRARV